jgi:hypothetical protein
MNVKQLRSIIRASINKQVSEYADALRSPPSSFSTFRHRLIDCLEAAEAPAGLIKEIRTFKKSDGAVFECIWNCWADIENEMKTAKTVVKKNDLWKEVIDFYLRTPLFSLLEEYRDFDSRRTVDIVMEKMLYEDEVAAKPNRKHN